MVGLLLGPESLKGMVLVQLSWRTWYSVTTTVYVYFQGSVENFTATQLSVLSIVHTKQP